MPPCIMPNNAFGLSPWASFERCAQRSDNSIESFDSVCVAGYGVHSSKIMTTSEFKLRCTSIERSGVSIIFSPFTGELKRTPSSVILRVFPKLKTWKPPESVKMGLSQFIKPCKPPCCSIMSVPGRNIK